LTWWPPVGRSTSTSHPESTDYRYPPHIAAVIAPGQLLKGNSTDPPRLPIYEHHGEDYAAVVSHQLGYIIIARHYVLLCFIAVVNDAYGNTLGKPDSRQVRRLAFPACLT
jgi:hypothetical protein